jgi:hypothetical protein
MNLKLASFLFVCAFISCNGQKPFGTEHLKLEKTIEMPGVKGRIDHMAVNLKTNIIYIAALGNNSIEVVDLNKGTIIHSIKELDEPQGVAYIPESNELVVANGGDGNCIFYNASTYEVIATVKLKGDADNVRYDADTRKVYVGYGDGGIAVLDAITHKETGNVILPAHPESFQIDKKHDLLFVNLPGDNSIAVIELKSLKLTGTWKIQGLRANFPMALDTATGSVIIGFRHPAMLVSYDAVKGKEQNRVQLVSDVDDVFFDQPAQEVFASGGGGYINIFKRENDGFKKIANIPTRSGARTCLLVPSSQTLILAERETGGNAAALAVYKIIK